MNTLMMILLTIASWGQNFKSLIGLSSDIQTTSVKSACQLDKYPWMADIRKKMQNLSNSDKNAAIAFLQKHLDSNVAYKLQQFEACQAFESIMIHDDQARMLINSLAHETSEHGEQRAILLMVLVLGDTDRSGTSINIRSYISQFEQEGITIVPTNASWGLKTKTGLVVPGEIIEKFIK